MGRNENNLDKLNRLASQRYEDSQQDLIKGKDEYIAKLCNDRAELKDELKELKEFVIFVVNYLIEHRIKLYTNDNNKIDLVKKVVEKYGQEKQ